MYRLREIIYRFINYMLSFALAGIIVLTSVCALLSLASNDAKLITNQMASAKVTARLSQELDDRLIEIAGNYNMPEDMLINAIDNSIRLEAERVSASLMRKGTAIKLTQSTNAEKRVLSFIDDYVEDNGIKLKDSDKQRMIDEMLNAFTKTYTILNVNDFARFSSLFTRQIPVLTFALIFVGIFLTVLLYFFNNRRHRVLSFYGMSFITAGEILLSFSAIGYFSSGRLLSSLTNIIAYNEAIINMSKLMCYTLAGVGVINIIIGAILFAVWYRYYTIKYVHDYTDREIQNNLIF